MIHVFKIAFLNLQMAIMEERWSTMEAGNGHSNGQAYAPGGKGVAGGDHTGMPGSVSNQYLARMTQYYTEGNQVRNLDILYNCCRISVQNVCALAFLALRLHLHTSDSSSLSLSSTGSLLWGKCTFLAICFWTDLFGALAVPDCQSRTFRADSLWMDDCGP